MNEIVLITAVGFATGITTVLFGFGGGFVVVPFVYQIISRQPALVPDAMHIAVATSTAVMICNAGWASFQNWRAGRLPMNTLFPLVWFIAVGAVAGTLLARWLAGGVVRCLFVAYLLLTLADCLMRQGFLRRPAARRLSGLTIGAGGTAIGIIAALLGVGGSVMTVPLLRRHGYAMRDCVSAANPLSLPVAICGAATWCVSGLHLVSHSGYLGFINLQIAALLSATGCLGILFARYAIPPVADRLHARIYLLLLLTVLLAMAL
ncbi:sulfite exporter TauE/SafE family protein [Mixta tenebrionis]|uniref:Probable membrane transporter protein n=1 Tax=Mixta tenebrionis TaxID=2562439 RepID=A0A506VC72_9GAMM|nr:sulfite exporter TauE/SafE family protein [Mixta tenebrionis]TPW43059.1 sulfite exporter TauE/SafE family protein [Mixta tenebrionis]